MAAERVNPPGNKSVISIHHNSYLDRIMGNSKVKFVEFLRTSPPETRGMRARVLLAPGSMAAMDTPFLSTLSICLAARELDVARFEFDYMAARRSGGKRRPPPRAEALCPEYLNAVGAFKSQEHEPVPL
ncbi:MAG TPA: alpha/beta family hydrolase, partial [Hyphomicrobiaceae bacterium]|nr:alpha/beta family hydrolase [Hyphomicrobiaceae bacterium]